MECSRPEYRSGQPFPSPGDPPNPGIEPRSPALQAGSLPAEPEGSPEYDRRMSSHTWPHFVPSTDLQGRFPILQLEKVVHGDVYCFIQGHGDVNEKMKAGSDCISTLLHL